MSAVKYTIHFTAMCGSEATITGDSDAIMAIEDAFEMAGIKFNDRVECWDAGFYDQPKPKHKVTRSGRHIREKH